MSDWHETKYDPAEGCLPCPHCGVPAHIHTSSDGRGGMWGIEHYENIPETGCPISVYGFYKPRYRTREAAVAAWNTRKSVILPDCVLPLEYHKEDLP